MKVCHRKLRNSVFFLALLAIRSPSIFGIKWLAIHKISAPNPIQPQCPKNKEQRKELGMLTTQARLCRKMPALMPVVTNAARYAVHTCQGVFENRRWNCSSVNFAPKLKPDLTKGTKEQAFVYALSAAAVTHQIAKACATGELGSHCTCGYGDSTAVTAEMGSVAPNVEDTYKWKGCSDNLLFGKQLSREWTDSAWRRVHSATFNTNDYAIKGGVQRRGLLFGRKRNIQSNGNGFMDGDVSTYFVEGITSRTLGPKARMNQHNSDVGRQITEQSLYRKCKCHGVSSSCDVRTCWYTLPPLEQIADRIKERYSSAQMINQLYPDDVKIDTRSLRMTADSKHELVFIKSSPDYCEENSELGSPGTNMRECNVTSIGPDSCESLCCGRGFNTQQIRVEEQCHCKYVHCCYIKCKRCAYVLDKHYCK
ncbi:wnt family domain-containing protein [Ditylenchus destructor]|uniref:Protein Wnt n=1 Tax=Ditylenchus destructor TaxID=166010 RepID=A0AAD4R667_9BILA|nr:wnt family domain-containing protein [Ditylenchus destructor]